MKGLLQMALVEMKKITLLALNQDRARLFRQMQRLGCVQVLECDDAARAGYAQQEKGRLDELSKLVNRLDLAILRLTPFDKHKAGLLEGKRTAGADQVAAVTASRDEVMAVVERVEEIERTRGELRARETREKAQIEQLRPFAALDIPLEKLGKTKTSQLMLISLPEKAYDEFAAQVSELGAASLEELSRQRETVNLLAGVHESAAEGFAEALKTAGGARVNLPGESGTPALIIDQLTAKLARIEQVRAQLSEEFEKLAEQLVVLRVLRDVMALEQSRLEASARCAGTRSAFLLSGWAPAYRAQEIEKALKKAAPLCEVEFSDPGEDEKPPTLMKNNKYVAPFESIVKMFSLPDPNGVDPTFIMLPFWVCFFGMMVSDAGYGVLLGLAGAFIWHKTRGKGIGGMAWILALGGLSTLIWGAIYGGWFGNTPYTPLLDPMNDAITVLIVCIAAGAVHLLAGLGMAIYMNIRRGKWLDALFDQVFWIMILAGLGLMVVNTQVGGVIALLGAVGVVLTAGRAKKNIFSRLIGGLGALYGVTSYLSDLLSYARLFGMGLATGVIGMVINMLATLLMGSPIGIVFAIAILAGGHALNLAINTLGAYVHSCRLQYIEFFNKFYESGGRDFMPLANNTRYVDIADNEAQ